MEISEWLRAAKKQIDSLDAELIALKCFAPAPDLDRSWLVAHGDLEASDAEVADKMVLRRSRGEPLAYILGEKEFYGRRFLVDSRVLIPRPETEDLAAMALEIPCKRVLEVGVGSGCIAITLKLERPSLEVTAVDISPAALAVARENAKRLGAEIALCQSDLLANLPKNAQYDVIIANLPYVDADWEWLNRANLAYEPAEALFAGEKGLALYHGLFVQIRQIWPENGPGAQKAPILLLEADPCQHGELAEMAKTFGFCHVETRGYAMKFERATLLR